MDLVSRVGGVAREKTADTAACFAQHVQSLCPFSKQNVSLVRDFDLTHQHG